MGILKKGLMRAVTSMRDRPTKLKATVAERQSEPRSADSEGLFVPPGHYYSPIVDTVELAKTKHMDRVQDDLLLGIDQNEPAMMVIFDRLKQHFHAIEFPDTKSQTHRYYYQNDFYTYGDAIFLSAMI